MQPTALLQTTQYTDTRVHCAYLFIFYIILYTYKHTAACYSVLGRTFPFLMRNDRFSKFVLCTCNLFRFSQTRAPARCDVDVSTSERIYNPIPIDFSPKTLPDERRRVQDGKRFAAIE